MPEPVHCDEKMELARLIPRFQALPELLVFRCPHCGHVETIQQPALTALKARSISASFARTRIRCGRRRSSLGWSSQNDPVQRRQVINRQKPA